LKQKKEEYVSLLFINPDTDNYIKIDLEVIIEIMYISR
jgi:hypothetical protein